MPRPSAASSRNDKDAITLPADFVLDSELSAAYHYMEFSSDTFFLTGRAGTGKSTLLNYFRKYTVKKYVILAPTGLAAIQVGGNTIHSFFGFPLRTMMRNDPDIRVWGKGHPRAKIIRNMDTLIIDEVSMVRADILDAIDQSLRLNMGNDIPFGGKQIIFIGDVFQLPPVVTSHDQSYQSYTMQEEEYADPYFFNARAFVQCHPKMIELRKIYRQQNDDFIYLLNRIRMGVAGNDDLAMINKRYVDEQFQEEDFAITLTSVNALADKVNQQKLMDINASSFLYKGKTEGTFHEKLYPATPSLQLKSGAQVMMVKNDLQGRWVNGSIGKVTTLTEREVKVQFADGSEHVVDPVVWENKTYHWDSSNNTITFEVHGTYTQHPIRLAWAITIHKSQGLTFDKIIVNLGRGAFAHGQLYVALSRCKTLEGITLRTPITPKDMIVDDAVERFAGRFGISGK